MVRKSGSVFKLPLCSNCTRFSWHCERALWAGSPGQAWDEGPYTWPVRILALLHCHSYAFWLKFDISVCNRKYSKPNGSSRSTKWPADGIQWAITQGLLNARTSFQCISALQFANPTKEADIATQLVLAPAGDLSPMQQLIIRPGESGLLTSKFQVSKFCAEETLILSLVLYITCSRIWADWHFLIAISQTWVVGENESLLWATATVQHVLLFGFVC